jgi:hypothetical protein
MSGRADHAELLHSTVLPLQNYFYRPALSLWPQFAEIASYRIIIIIITSSAEQLVCRDRFAVVSL